MMQRGVQNAPGRARKAQVHADLPQRTPRFSQPKDVLTFFRLIIFWADFDIRLSTRSKK